MSGTYSVVMGDRGRLVVPAELRSRAGLVEGAPVVLIETEQGVVLMTRGQARDYVRNQLGESRLVASLLADRRRAAEGEDIA